VDKAVALVLQGDVELHDDGTAQVYSQSNGVAAYHLVGGTCDCDDYPRAPSHWCKHKIAVGLQQRALQAVAQSQEGVDAMTEVPVEPPAGIDPRHIVLIQGRPFVKFAGLLELAHKRGLQELKVDWTYNDAEFSLAHAVAVFPFGRFEESGDATPANVNRKVAPHFRRCALTRAAARCLRLALGLDMVAVEELAEE
jgi:hypothetical protein